MHNEWYIIDDIDGIDSPALVVYPDRISRNIKLAIDIAGDITKLRPHVKTNKIAEVCSMMMDAGITKFKCATIAETEMLVEAGATDILLAYQPVGPKTERFAELAKAYPGTRFSCLVDDSLNAKSISETCVMNGCTIDVFIDLNVGMNRTGTDPETAVVLAGEIAKLENIRLAGIHAYDGHIHDTDLSARQKAADASFAIAEKVYNQIKNFFTYPLVMVMGGTPTFPVHAHRSNCEVSPGTFVFWDWGYMHMLPDLPFEYAALVVSRVISVTDRNHVCVDLGHKSVAAENPLPRVHFINAPEASPAAQSEEHLVLEVPDSGKYPLGTVLYGVPVHICPTVALYEKAYVIGSNKLLNYWNIKARNRYINY